MCLNRFVIFQPEIYKNFQSIQFKPEQFVEYLLSSEVGFSKSEVIAVPLHQAQGNTFLIFLLKTLVYV